MARKIKHCARFSAQARHDRRVDALYNAEMHGSRSMAIPTRIDLAAPSHEDDGFSPARRDGPMDVPMQMVFAQAPDGPVDGTPLSRGHTRACSVDWSRLGMMTLIAGLGYGLVCETGPYGVV